MKLSCTRIGLFGAAILFTQQVDALCSGELKVSNQADLDKARSCKTYSGNIIVENSAANSLSLNGVELLEGNLLVTGNDVLQVFSMPNLQGVNGEMRFANNKILASLDLKQLHSLRSFEVSVHPALNEIRFAAGLSDAEKIIITDTTITRIEGFKMKSIQDISISNNIYLKSFTLTNTTSANNILISANSPNLQADLSNVQSIHESTFRNVASLNLDGLSKVSGDLSFISNTFDKLDMPSITDVSGTLTLTDNMQLNNLSMAKLSHLGGALSVSGNNNLISITSFPNLQQVDGTVDITGGFDEVELPALNDVRGGLNVQTTSNTFKCDTVSKLKNGVIKGNAFTCKGGVAAPKSGIRNGKGGKGSGNDGFDSAASTNSVSYFVLLASLAYFTQLY